MKIELKAFQETARRNVLDELEEARTAVGRNRNKLQAVVLSAPTGSGKTIAIAAVIDQTFGGGDGVPARPDTVFLWLSDSPELNIQSMNKLTGACDHLSFTRMVTVDSESFDEERLRPGHLYFINTQLLGKDKRLTQGGDKRQFTFWQTVANTVAEAPQDFVLIIDEAHRGAAANDRNRTPIMQKFILGSEADELPPVPLVLGMSATPQRFSTLLGNTTRTERKVVITPEDVRSSGLLKDLILVHNPKTTTQTDLTLLEYAADRWMYFRQRWKTYCDKEREPNTVRPILVVQVEDGSENVVTRTNLADVIRVIERKSGPLSLHEIVHCFQDQSDLQVGQHIVRKIEPSRIQDSPDVKVVLFKTALTTGWDCPRAEVMMSFRRSQDVTTIAQLVGRMIRTPLARRIERDEVLNTVELSLPHYDAEALESVLSRLRSPDAEEGVPTRVETEAMAYARNPAMTEVFDLLRTLPTVAVNRAPKIGDMKRALRLAGLLVHEGIDQDADETLRETLTRKLKKLRDLLADKNEDWGKVARERAEVEVDVTQVAIGTMSVSGQSSMRMTLSNENIDQLFDVAGRVLASGEGLHRTYWKKYHDHAKPNEVKLELYAVTRSDSALLEMEKLAGKEFAKLWEKHKRAIGNLPAGDRARFQSLNQSGGNPVEQDWELPDQIVEKPAEQEWEYHLYCDESGKFGAKLNGWEQAVLEGQMSQPGFVGWLRNLPRRDWALCVPYELGDVKPFYPDFVMVRNEDSHFVVDIFEPHDDTRTDTWAKAKGLAKFADEHGLKFGRLMIGRKKGDEFQFADVNDRTTREKALRMQSPNDLEFLFR